MRERGSEEESERGREGEYVTMHAKTLRKSLNFFVEIESDFASPIFNLPLLQILYG